MNQPIPFAVLFDMDGTLLKTEDVAIPAFRQTFEQLKEQGEYHGESPSDEKIKSVFGMTLDMIWEELLPDQSPEIRKKADRMMLAFEIEQLKKGNGRLYDGVRETLERLDREQIPLFVASNGLDEYIRAVCRYVNIERLFTDLYSAGRFNTRSKNDLVAKLLSDYDIGDGVMVGDRHSDVKAGKVNGLFTIGCEFGFADSAELKDADVKINRFQQMLPIILKQLQNLKNSRTP